MLRYSGYEVTEAGSLGEPCAELRGALPGYEAVLLSERMECGVDELLAAVKRETRAPVILFGARSGAGGRGRLCGHCGVLVPPWEWFRAIAILIVKPLDTYGSNRLNTAGCGTRGG